MARNDKEFAMKDSQNDVVYEGRFLRFLKAGDWEYIQRTNCTGIVIIVAMTDDHKVVLIRQYRKPVKTNVIEFPAGLINDHTHNESAETAARREFFEETGYEAQEFIKVFSGPGGAGASSDILTFYLAKGIRKTGDGGGDRTEDIEVLEIPIHEVEDFLRQQNENGVLSDPKIYAGLYFLNKYNKTS